MAQGEFTLVRELIEKAIKKAGNLGVDPDLYAMMADAAVQQRDLIALREYAPLLENAAMSLGHNLYLATAHRAWGVLHMLESQFEEAKVRLDQAAALFLGLDTRWQLGRTHFELGELAVAQADTAEAHRQYSNALNLFEEMKALPDAARTRSELALLDNHTH